MTETIFKKIYVKLKNKILHYDNVDYESFFLFTDNFNVFI